MKKIISRLIFNLVMLIPMMLSAQIPNPDFEDWDSVTLTRPAVFRVYGITRKVTGFNSPFAVRIQEDMNNNNGGPGAIIYGDPEHDFSGGIPAVGRPDSAVGYFKYHLVPGDSAWFLVYLKRNGAFISHDIFYLTGSDSSTFHRLAFRINYSDTGVSDSLVIGVTSTNPNVDKTGSFVTVDSIHLKGGIGQVIVPNGSFEQWEIFGFNNLRAWFTSNSQGVPGKIFPVSRSSGVLSKYACRIENIPLGGGQYLPGYIMAGRQGDFGPEPGFKVQGYDSLLYCQYKCSPQGGDTINIAVMMFRNDSMVGMGSFRQWQDISNWTLASIPINYWNGVPDSAVIFCSAFQGGNDPQGNSILFVDGLKFNEPFSGMSSPWLLPLRVYPNPAVNILSIEFSYTLNPNTSVSIMDATGRKINVPIQISDSGKSVQINTAGLNTGTWYYELKSDKGFFKGSFIILK